MSSRYLKIKTKNPWFYLHTTVIAAALSDISQADLLIVGGTSLVVYPAAGFIEHFLGKHLVLINRDPTPYDQRADLIIRGGIGDALSQAV